MIKSIADRIRAFIAKLVMPGDQSGATTLIMTLVLLMLSTLIILFAAQYGRLQDKAISNINRSHQAFEAAQAGLEYGVNYLNKFSTAILANPVSGYIPAYSDSNTNNVALANNSRYTITYSNPVAFNYKLIKISSTGTSDDGTSTRTVSQLVKFGSMLLNAPTEPVVTKGSASFDNDSEIRNQYNNTTIKSASSVTLLDDAETILSSGVSSNSSTMGSDVVQNNSVLGNMSTPDFFANHFGIAASMLKKNVTSYYNYNVDTNYRSMLSGQSGTSIWIDQTSGTATINGLFLIGTVIGTSSNPVLLIINGNSKFTGIVTIYGFVYIEGTNNIASGANVQIIGGIATTGNMSGLGTIQIFYSPTVLTNLQNQAGMQYYAKVPGSWKDF